MDEVKDSSVSTLSFKVGADLVQDLDEISQAEERTRSSTVRLALKEYVEAWRHQRKQPAARRVTA